MKKLTCCQVLVSASLKCVSFCLSHISGGRTDPCGSLGAPSKPCFGRPWRNRGKLEVKLTNTEIKTRFNTVFMEAAILSRENA